MKIKLVAPKNTASFLAQAITKSAHALNDVPRFSKLLAKTANVSIDRSSVDYAFVTPHLVEQTIPLLHAAALLHQRPKKFELETGQLDRFAIHQNFVARRIDRNRPGRHAILCLFGTSTAQNRFN